MSTSCRVPPDATLRPEENVPPRFDLLTVDPEASLFDADPRCSCVKVRVTAYDDDDDRLLVRLATNVGRDTDRARCVREILVGEALRGRPIEQSVVPANELIGFPAEDVHTISMFVTDAPSFAFPIDGPAESCGLVASDGGVGSVVIEQRWAVRFIPGLGQCYGCALTGGP